MYKLVVKNGKDKGRQLIFHQDLVIIGRDPDCQVHLGDDHIAWRHAELKQDDQVVSIKNIELNNSISQNGNIVTEATLCHGDIIKLGKTRLEFRQPKKMAITQKRRTSYIQYLMRFVVGILLLSQCIYLSRLLLWPVDSTESLEPQNSMPETASLTNAPVVELNTNELAKTEPPKKLIQKPEPKVSEPKKSPQEKTPKVEIAKAEDKPETNTPTSKIEKEPAKKIAVKAKEKEPLEKRIASKRVPKTNYKTVPKITQKPKFDATLLGEDLAPLFKLANDMLNNAKLAMARDNYQLAEQQLERIEIMAPTFYPAYVERAKLYESIGKFKEAEDYWKKLANRAEEAIWQAYAVAQGNRVAKRAEFRNSVKPSSKNQKSVTKASKDVNINVEAIRIRDFLDSKEFDEMRLVSVTLKYTEGPKFLLGEDVAVYIKFFDRDIDSRILYPTRAYVQESAVRLDGSWQVKEIRTVNAAYIAPLGFRKQEQKEHDSKRSFYGCVVQVIYKGNQLDIASRPQGLLDLIPEKSLDNTNTE